MTHASAGWECPRCHVVHAPTVASCTCAPVERSLADRIAGARQTGLHRLNQPGQFDPSLCPCNPSRGGSGICGCIMGGTKVTC